MGVDRQHRQQQYVKSLTIMFMFEYILYEVWMQCVQYSLFDGDTTLGENIRYFMYKYKMSYKDWHSPFIILINTTDT